MKACISRRTVIGTLPALIAQAATAPSTKKAKALPKVGEFTRLTDPATENILVRLTALSSVAELPHPSNRFIAARDRALVFSSNRTGAFAPFHLDLHSGVLQQLATTPKLDVRSLSLDHAERSLFLLDSGQVKEVSLSSKRDRVLADGVRQFVVGRTAENMFVLRGDSIERVDGQKIADGADSLLLTDADGRRCIFTRPSGSAGRELWFVDSETRRPALIANEQFSFPFWSPDEQAILFLQGEIHKAQITQVTLPSMQHDVLSRVGPIACFAPNANASVFAAALGSKAQPFVMLMLRSPRTETTLCEHHASDAAAVTPVFSPDSHRVYFQSNREGQNAIYSIDVSTLIEPTSAEAG